MSDIVDVLAAALREASYSDVYDPLNEGEMYAMSASTSHAVGILSALRTQGWTLARRAESAGTQVCAMCGRLVSERGHGPRCFEWANGLLDDAIRAESAGTLDVTFMRAAMHVVLSGNKEAARFVLGEDVPDYIAERIKVEYDSYARLSSSDTER